MAGERYPYDMSPAEPRELQPIYNQDMDVPVSPSISNKEGMYDSPKSIAMDPQNPHTTISIDEALERAQQKPVDEREASRREDGRMTSARHRIKGGMPEKDYNAWQKRLAALLSGNSVQTGEPMDLAWRLLKGKLI